MYYYLPTLYFQCHYTNYIFNHYIFTLNKNAKNGPSFEFSFLKKSFEKDRLCDGHFVNIRKSKHIQVALTLHGFTLHDPHFTQGLCFCQMDSHYVVHYTISSLYTVKKHHLSIKDTVFHFTRISLYTIYLEKQKSCKVRATCSLGRVRWVCHTCRRPSEP